jgi:hypothetical protein
MATAHLNFGVALKGLFRFDEAEQAFARATQFDPQLVEAWSNLADSLSRRQQFDAAERALKIALSVRPEFTDALMNWGVLEARRGNFPSAISRFDQILASELSAADARWNRGLSFLSIGDLVAGWRDYESRFSDPRFPGRHYPSLGKSRLTRADELTGCDVLLYGEQGLGDCIQFARYVPLVSQLAKSVRLLVNRRLHRLFASMPDIVLLDEVPNLEGLEPISLMSLPHLFGTTLDNIPFPDGYLKPDKRLMAQWSSRLRLGASPTVGLVWRAGNSPIMPNRGMPFELLQSALPSQLRYVCLHLEVDDQPRGVEFIGHEQQDFADTAAILTQLDIVITVDTSVAHLGGALGKEVWILLNHVADWRWLQSRSDSPWYQSVQLVRQESFDDWNVPLQRVRRRLLELAE